MTNRRLAWMMVVLIGMANPAWTADSPEDLAQRAAESWLKLVDDGKFDESWTQAAKLFKGAVTQAQWQQSLTGARKPLGKLVSRKLKSRQLLEKLPGAPDGKYVICQFDASFESKSIAVETVTPMLEADGSWRVSGYYIK